MSLPTVITILIAVGADILKDVTESISKELSGLYKNKTITRGEMIIMIINCNDKHCKYNEYGKCNADYVNIEFESNSSQQAKIECPYEERE